MKIKAKFKGRNMSLGYIKDVVYYLDVKLLPIGSVFIAPVSSKSNTTNCVYSSIEMFLSNWGDVNLLK